MSETNFTLSRWKHFLVTVLLCSTTGLTLQACMPTLMVGGGVIGTVAATDRRTVGTLTEDKTISFKGEFAANKITGDQGHVNVTSFNRYVLITGEVANEDMKIRVENEITQIPNVRGITNVLVIGSPSTLSERSNDSLITSKVIASFVDAKDIYFNSLKTVTERGIVYLMGRVTEREGARAAEIVSGIQGVRRVVKVFEYISEEEFARMTKQEEASGNQATDKYEGNEYQ